MPAGTKWLLPVLFSMLFMYQADVTIVNVATPEIRQDLEASPAILQLVVSGYLVASATFLITGARLGHLLGYRRMFLVGVALFGTASLACGLAPSGPVLVAARVAQGVAGALAFPQVLTGIQVHFAAAERNRALSLYSLALAGGAVVGQLVGGLLISADVLGLGWRTVFLVNVPVTAAVVAIGGRVIPRDATRDRARSLDLSGALALSVAVLLLVLPLALGREQGWPVWTYVSMAASAPVLALFVVLERRRGIAGRVPLVDLDLICRPAIAWGLLPQALAVSTYYALLFVQAQYLQHGLGWSAALSGLSLVPWVAAFGVPGRLINRLPVRVVPRMPVIGCTLMSLTFAGLALTTVAGLRPGTVFLILMAMGGFGLGSSFSAILVHLTTAATPRQAPDISGVFTTTQQIAGSIGVAALGTVYVAASAGTGAGAAQGFSVVTGLCAAVALVAAAAGHRATRLTPSPPAPSADSPTPSSVAQAVSRGATKQRVQ